MPFITKENLTKNVSLAWPLAINSILVQSMVLIDLLLIAPLGEIPVNALGIATAIVAFLVGIQHAFANGTQMLVARAAGEDDADKIAIRLIGGWVLNISLTLGVVLAMIIGADRLLPMVIDHPDVLSQAIGYINICLWMLLASSVSQVLIVYFNGQGKTRIPMFSFMIEAPFNILVSLVLVYGLFGFPELGVQGAAVGTLVAVLIRVCYLGWRMLRLGGVSFHTGLKRLNGAELRNHAGEAAPIAANFITLTGGMMIYQLLFAQLNVYAYAAIALVMPWMRMGAQFVNAWSHATSIHVSQYRGRNTLAEIPDFVTQAVRITQLIALVMVAGFWVFSLLLPSLYPAMDAQTLQALAVIAPVYILTPLVRTYNTICGHTLRALGESFVVLRLHVITQWVISLPLLALLIALKAPLLLVFGITMLEEVLKTYFFRRRLHRKLNELRVASQ